MSHANASTAAGLSPAIPYTRERGNVLRLAVAQALAGANSVVVYATGAIVGNTLAPSRVLATLPISIFVVGMAACTLPAGAIARRHGRRAAFLAGTGCGVLTGLLAALAVVLGSFWLFCAATFFGGAYAAVVLSFRFAAADCVPPERRPRALSAVMAGGVVAGVIGPQLVTYTMDLWVPYLFAATYLAQAAVAAVSAIVLLGVRLPMPTAAEIAGGRPLGAIARQPRFITAAICGVVSYMLMNFIMTAAPLAMRLCGLSQEASNLGLQWHVIAMYAPSFFTGRLITRFGAPRVVAAGFALTATSAAVGLAGVEIAHFWLTLILLGVGWNFGFVGASALVLECHRPEERTRVQSLNDFIVFGTMALGSFSSGGLLTAYGWDTVLWVSFFPLTVAVAALASTAGSRPGRRIRAVFADRGYDAEHHRALCRRFGAEPRIHKRGRPRAGLAALAGGAQQHLDSGEQAPCAAL
jgi:MFS family permease